jgi:hypothetical protein
MAVGGAITNLLNAAHLLGYGGKMLSGGKVRRAEVIQAFCAPGEQLVGWITLGRPLRPGKPGGRGASAKPGGDVLMQDWPGGTDLAG